MKKIFIMLSACLVAGLMIVSCGKDNKDNGKKTDDQEGQEQEEEFVPLIAVDGQFADWADITGYEGEEGSYVAFKAAMDEHPLFLRKENQRPHGRALGWQRLLLFRP